QAHAEVDKEIQNLLAEIEELKKEIEKNKAELEKQQKKLEKAMCTKAILGFVSFNLNALGACFPPFGPIVASITTAVMEAAVNPSEAEKQLPVIEGHFNSIAAALEKKKE